MKKKTYTCFILILIILLVFPNIVNAKFSIADAEKKIDDNEILIELLDQNENTLKTVVLDLHDSLKENAEGFYYNGGYEFDCSNNTTEEIILHMFYQRPALKEDAEVEVSGEGCNVDNNKITKKFDDNYINGIELEIPIKPKNITSSATIKIKWEHGTGSGHDSNDEVVVEIKAKFKNNAYIIKKEEEEYKNAYKNVPNKNADAKTIKDFILSDEAYNGSKALKKVASEDMEKIEAWHNKVVELIKTDRHYASEDQYGSTKNKLKAIIDAYTESKSVEDAVDSVDTSGAAKILDDYYKRMKVKIASVAGEDREVHSDFKDVLTDTNEYKPNDANPPTEFYTIVSTVVSVITSVGMVLSILIIAILGVKYMLGSVDEKAEYKKDMIPYLIGAGLLFGVTVIVGALQKIGESINNI